MADMKTIDTLKVMDTDFKNWLGTIPKGITIKSEVVNDNMLLCYRVVTALVRDYCRERMPAMFDAITSGEGSEELKNQIIKHLLDVAVIMAPYLEEHIDADEFKLILEKHIANELLELHKQNS